ncbi:hypothetical protein [Thalassotalea profundi]|uniref:Uncharacterized protein n=1 Tax=Thalassotalea profundi TaxID=2036687 RepID=A0ABQ3IKT6_9GAMM|nr:hypothetical protein [Thalassotalea profundi]GHE82955.1 hypothetical protein GCM10011501_09120 [Thalassotalea profundi]
MVKTSVLFIGISLLATLLVCIVSTQIILAEVQSFGLSVSIPVRLHATMTDLVGLGPILFLIIASGFLIGFIIAKYAYQFIGGNRTAWFIAAGCTTFPLTMYLIQYTMGLTVIASARTPLGLFLITCCCIVSTWIYARLTLNNSNDNKTVQN